MTTALVGTGVLERKVAEAIKMAKEFPGYLELNQGRYPGTVEVNISFRGVVLKYLIEHQQKYGELPQIELTPALLIDRSNFSHIFIRPTEDQAMELARDVDEARLSGGGGLGYIRDIILDTDIGHLL